MRKQEETIKKILKRIRPYRLFVFCSLIFAVITVGTTLYAPILVGDAVDYILAEGKVDFAAIFHILKKLAVIICMTGAAQWLMNLCNNRITYCVVKE